MVRQFRSRVALSGCPADRLGIGSCLRIQPTKAVALSRCQSKPHHNPAWADDEDMNLYYWQEHDRDASKRVWTDRMKYEGKAATSSDSATGFETMVRSSLTGAVETASASPAPGPMPLEDAPAAPEPKAKAKGKAKGRAKAKTQPVKPEPTEEEKELEAQKKKLSDLERGMTNEIRTTFALLGKAESSTDVNEKPWILGLVEQVRKAVNKLADLQSNLRDQMNKPMTVEEATEAVTSQTQVLAKFKSGFKKDLAKVLS